ncbi:MAG: SUF system NifU family Fe-S cluster assembly protein [Candidatus Viridilinea halotolerans]|uniref:SUF system NifU family Fe-S cluster assembly protein n=1 Tax=Candidatus Viridilinea halotolerans TaxID=2491704 RepID=A0A426TTB1_9CHLR|nr:MAG: SUF system NifU family Fe-S cluster assembly protein [Candidatus Viridilinea halotolerans]
MDDLYQQQIIEHARHPHNFGTLDGATIVHEEHNPLCGDKVRIELIIEADVITDVRFSGQGCAISQASASLLTDELKGMRVATAKAYHKDDLLELIGIPLNKNPTRLRCALLSLKALKVGLYGVGHIHDDDL